VSEETTWLFYWPLSEQWVYSSPWAVALNHFGSRPHFSQRVLPFASTTKVCCSFTNPRGTEGWVSLVCWLSRCFTHKVITQPTSSLSQDRRGLLAETSILTTMLCCHFQYYCVRSCSLAGKLKEDKDCLRHVYWTQPFAVVLFMGWASGYCRQLVMSHPLTANSNNVVYVWCVFSIRWTW